MRTATKFVAPLTDEERLRLKEIHKTDPNWRTRMRAQAILLSEKGFAINQLATIFEIDRDSVSQWLDWRADYKFDGGDFTSGSDAAFDGVNDTFTKV